MTMHAHAHYECTNCRAHYVPFPPLDACPRCNTKASKAFFDFIATTLKSALFNLSKYDSFIPHGWATITVGDHYYWLAFRFLSYVSKSLKVDEKQLLPLEITEADASQLAVDFIAELNFGDQVYMANHLRSYFVRLLCERGPVSPEAQPPEISCFLSHSVNDKEFCNKLYSDLVASGIACWYFPEDSTFGKGTWSEIDKSMQSCDKIIVVCSRNSLRSGPVLREIERALQREDAEGKDILIPLRIDDYVLQEWQHPRRADVVAKVVGDFQQWHDQESYRKSLKRLINALQQD